MVKSSELEIWTIQIESVNHVESTDDVQKNEVRSYELEFAEN
jgi:hypothetical protein